MRFANFFFICGLVSAFVAPSVALPRQNVPRVVSLNLCADPYLMAFADKQQIGALTHLSRDATLSPHAQAAQNFPVSDGQIETLIDLAPDIVIVSSWSDPMRNALIERLGFKLMVMNAAQNYDAARVEILALGDAIGRGPQARAYLDKLDRDMETVAAKTSPPDMARIMPLQRRNVTVGRGHILDDIISRAGGVNLGRTGRSQAIKRVSLENALAVSADFILVNEAHNTPDSRGMEFLTHPALSAAYPPARRLFIDNNLLVCAGASTPRAVKALIEQLPKAP